MRRYAPALAIAALAALVASGFAVTVLQHTRPMGLPLDDAYIYLTYAKQFGRGQPFTYFPGGGYSAGATSILWPMLLAPLWALGARGHALVWASFAMCAALYAATCVGCYRIACDVAGRFAGIVAAIFVACIAPFAWCALSGMEVALASALVIATLLLLVRAPREGPPSRLLGVVLAATALARPEALVLVVAIAGAYAIHRVLRRDVRAALWWLVPLAAPAAWLVANRVFAGHFMPNTGVAKSHFYQPGFDWAYWVSTFDYQIKQLWKRVFASTDSPLVWPRVFEVMWLAGVVRVLVWARRHRRRLAGIAIVGAPIAWVCSVIGSSGQWELHDYRYIAPVFPLIAMTAAIGIAPVRWRRGGVLERVWWVAMIDIAALYACAAWSPMRSEMLMYAQDASDLNGQTVALGEHIHNRTPDASIMFHDAGAIAYYGDTAVFDMIGLVTNDQAEVANNGPGARFEMLESLPPERRPTHFAYYPGWMGQPDFFGDVVFATPLQRTFSRRRMTGAYDMELIVANWDHVGTAERPLDPHPGWSVVDRLDIADLASERAHDWRGRMGRRLFTDTTARWSVVEREVGEHGLVIDGGRTIRGASEHFAIAFDPAKPVRLVMRTGGLPVYGFNEQIDKRVAIRILDDDRRVLARRDIPPPAGVFIELAFDLGRLPARELLTDATGPYRVFHWFVLQPE
jgi:hypothetical protein